MFDYLQKFNNLPKELRDKVSSKEVMDKVLKLENKYGVELAALIMKVMIKTIPIKSLPRYISSEFSLGAEDSKELSNQLFIHVFKQVADYLGIKDEFKKNKEYSEISDLVKKTGIKLASDDLLNRLKNIILTYKKGVRDKINTKNSLAKPVEIGGLGLSDEEVDKVFSVISKENKDLNRGQNIDKNTSRDKLDRIIKEAEGLSGAYDLKKAIEEKNKQENQNEIKNQDDKLNENKLEKEEREIKNEEENKEEDKIKEEEQEKEKEIKKIAAAEKIKNLPLEEKDKSLPRQDKELYFRKPKKTLNLPLEKEEDEEEFREEEIENEEIIDKEIKEVNKKEEDKEKEKGFEKLNTSEDTLKKEIDKEIRNLENKKKHHEDVELKSEKEETKEDEKSVDNKNINQEKEDKTKKEEIKKDKLEEEKKDKEKESQDVKVEDKKEENKNVSNSIPVNPNFKRPAPGFSSKRPVLDDMKPVSKMMNPVEELKFLNLKNFRRLGANPEESCKRIFNKIKLLERDGYDKMIEGIKAWHSSEVNQLYVKIGRESILKGKKMREIIVERQKRDLPALKEEEIKAIANLNSRLVF